MRPPAIAAALLAVAACAAPPPAAPPEPPPPLLHAALEEWRGWGRIVVEGWPEDRPFLAATPERFERLMSYWRATPGGWAVADRLAAARAGLQAAAVAAPAEIPEGGGLVAVSTPVEPASPEDIGFYNRPFWSAAFVSAVAGRAGLDLPPSATHARYVDALLARAATDPAGANFLPFDPAERAPRPGDLLCADRSVSAPLWHWRDRLAEEGVPRPMHCDVVLRAAPGVVEAIGGNVQDVVALRRLPADREGRVLPAPPGRPRFFVVLAAR